jgi:MoaA/NifB/PqqE/SkfB family radical SAM enzyme
MTSLSNPSSKLTHYLINHPEVLMERKLHGFAYPVHAEIDLTWRCALDCKGCHSKHLHSGIELQPDQIKHILTELHAYGLEAVTFSGGGDPMESPHFEYAVNFAADLGLAMGLYTYFPNPTQERVSYLDYRFDWIYSHPFQAKGFHRFKRHAEEGGALGRWSSRAHWTAGFLLDESNWHKAAEMAAKVDLGFFDGIDFRPLCPENKPDAKPLNYQWVKDAIFLLKQISHDEPRITWAEYKFNGLLNGGKREYDKCLSTDLVALVGPDGQMWECVQRRGYPDSALGNLLTESLEDIWRRKTHCRTDLANCRILCRNDQDNVALYQLLGPSPKHSAFL